MTAMGSEPLTLWVWVIALYELGMFVALLVILIGGVIHEWRHDASNPLPDSTVSGIMSDT